MSIEQNLGKLSISEKPFLGTKDIESMFEKAKVDGMMVKILTERQFYALSFRYYVGLTFTEIAKDLGHISRQRAKQLVKAGEKRIVNYSQTGELPEQSIYQERLREENLKRLREEDPIKLYRRSGWSVLRLAESLHLSRGIVTKEIEGKGAEPNRIRILDRVIRETLGDNPVEKMEQLVEELKYEYKVAEALRISARTLHNWRRKLGLPDLKRTAA